MSTFLKLCQDLASELHLPDGAIASVVNQSGEADRIIRYLRDADLDNQRRYTDWKFLWSSPADTTVLDASTLTTLQQPADLSVYDITSFWLDKTLAAAVHLNYVPYKYYRDTLKVNPQTSATPQEFTITPAKNILVWPQANVSQTITCDYWIAPAPMTANAEVSIIPAQFHRLIVARGMVYYANAEDAPEVLAGAAAEHDGLLDALEADQGPNQQGRHMFDGNQEEQRVFAS